MEPYLINAAIAGLGYALAAVLSKRALQAGCGILRLSFFINWCFVALFGLLLLGKMQPVDWSLLHRPILTGACFFAGQLFTFAAIRMGDVSLQTPVMGTKAVFVVCIALWLGTEVVTPALWIAAIISMVAVALLGFSGGGVERAGLTIVLALLSALFFAGSDTLVGMYGGGFGPASFLFIVMLTNGILSFGLVPFFNAPLRQISATGWKWACWAGLAMSGQALLMNYTIATSEHVSAINILYSSRGLWSVLLAGPVVLLLGMQPEATTRATRVRRLIGALLLSGAIAVIVVQ